MGYYVKFIPWKKSAPQWKVQYISFKKADTQKSIAKKPKREWDIKKTRWSALGFNSFMTLQEAKARAKQLNSQRQLKRQEEQLKKIESTNEEIQRRYDSVLPSEFVAEFELRFIRKRDSQTEQGLRKNTRAYVAWRAAQRMITAVGEEPSEWFCHTYRVYDYFYQQKMSLRYLSTVLKLANLWGFFICRKMARPFLPVPLPRGYERQRLIDANYEKLIEDKNFRRPIRLTMVRHFGAGVTLYGGRKGFSDLMLSKNQLFENISVWMGHSTLQRTWRSYKSRRKFHLAGY